MSAVAMTTASSQLAAEMWTSLRALLASHAAMHSIARPQDVWTIAGNDDVGMTVKAAHGTLHWNAPAANGSGSWQVEATDRSEHGSYEFTGDGFLRIDNKTDAIELEAAVELLLHKLQIERRA